MFQQILENWKQIQIIYHDIKFIQIHQLSFIHF
jgi:hypothetical protein